jgi:hypothetical protein
MQIMTHGIYLITSCQFLTQNIFWWTRAVHQVTPSATLWHKHSKRHFLWPLQCIHDQINQRQV